LPEIRTTGGYNLTVHVPDLSGRARYHLIRVPSAVRRNRIPCGANLVADQSVVRQGLAGASHPLKSTHRAAIHTRRGKDRQVRARVRPRDRPGRCRSRGRGVRFRSRCLRIGGRWLRGRRFRVTRWWFRGWCRGVVARSWSLRVTRWWFRGWCLGVVARSWRLRVTRWWFRGWRLGVVARSWGFRVTRWWFRGWCLGVVARSWGFRVTRRWFRCRRLCVVNRSWSFRVRWTAILRTVATILSHPGFAAVLSTRLSLC
jgi:hypothetical protein